MLHIVGLGESKELASNIARHLGQDWLEPVYEKTEFSDGEFEVRFVQSVRGDNIYLICSTVSPESILELLLAIDAAKHASANQVVAVIPYFGYARQDRKSKARISVGAKVLAKCIEAVGADRVVTIDLHAAQEQSFFDIPVDHLPITSVYLDLLRAAVTDNAVIATPDVGGAKRAETYSKLLGLPLVLCHKHRDKPNEVSTMKLIGDVTGKDVFLVDDMIDTGGTICKAADLLMENGAKNIVVLATHGVLSGSAIDRLCDCNSISNVILSNTIYPKTHSAKFIYCDISDFLSKVIAAIDNGESISKYLN